MASQVTLKTIAKKSGVSVSTVCLALSGHPRVSRKTRERIQRISDELGYRHAEQRILSQASFGLVILGRGHTDKTATGLLAGLCHAAAARNWRVEVIAIPDLDDRTAVKNRLRDSLGNLAGLFLTDMVDLAMIADVVSLKVPAIVVGDILADPEQAVLPPSMTQVTPDTIAMGRAATRYLIGQGRTPVMFLSYEGPPGLYHNRWLTGHMAALSEARLPVDDNLIHQVTTETFDPRAIAQRLTSLSQPPQGFVLPDPELAFQLLNVMELHRDRIPAEAVVLGGTSARAAQLGLQNLPLVEADVERWAASAMVHMDLKVRGVIPWAETIYCPMTRHNFPA